MYLSIENTPIFSLSGKYIRNYLLLGNSFINDTFLTSDECVKDLDSKCLFYCSTLLVFVSIQSNWENALEKTYFISSK